MDMARQVDNNNDNNNDDDKNHDKNGKNDNGEGGKGVMVRKTRQDLTGTGEELSRIDRRINRLQSLLDDLQEKKERIESGRPPAEEHPMHVHVRHLADVAGISDDDLVFRTRRNGEKEASGFTKQGVIELAGFVYGLQHRLEYGEKPSDISEDRDKTGEG